MVCTHVEVRVCTPMFCILAFFLTSRAPTPNHCRPRPFGYVYVAKRWSRAWPSQAIGPPLQLWKSFGEHLGEEAGQDQDGGKGGAGGGGLSRASLRLLVPLGGNLGPSWSHLGSSLAHHRPSWLSWMASCVVLEAMQGQPGRLGGHLGRPLSPSWAINGVMEAALARCGWPSWSPEAIGCSK